MFTKSREINFVSEIPEETFACQFILSSHARTRAKERFDDQYGSCVGSLCTWALESMSRNAECLDALLSLRRGSEFGIRYTEHSCFVMILDDVKTVKMYNGNDYTLITLKMKTCFDERQDPENARTFFFKKDLVFDVKTARNIVIE